MNKKYLCLALFMIIGSLQCNLAFSEIVRFSFLQGGYEEDAYVLGKIDAFDSNGDFAIHTEEFNIFELSFSGNSKVPAFSFNLTDFSDLYFGFDHGTIRATSTSYNYLSDICYDSYGEPCITSKVFIGEAISISSEHMQPSPVPVPAAVWLFASGILGLFGFKRFNAY